MRSKSTRSQRRNPAEFTHIISPLGVTPAALEAMVPNVWSLPMIVSNAMGSQGGPAVAARVNGLIGMDKFVHAVQSKIRDRLREYIPQSNNNGERWPGDDPIVYIKVWPHENTPSSYPLLVRVMDSLGLDLLPGPDGYMQIEMNTDHLRRIVDMLLTCAAYSTTSLRSAMCVAAADAYHVRSVDKRASLPAYERTFSQPQPVKFERAAVEIKPGPDLDVMGRPLVTRGLSLVPSQPAARPLPPIPAVPYRFRAKATVAKYVLDLGVGPARGQSWEAVSKPVPVESLREAQELYRGYAAHVASGEASKVEGHAITTANLLGGAVNDRSGNTVAHISVATGAIHRAYEDGSAATKTIDLDKVEPRAVPDPTVPMVYYRTPDGWSSEGESTQPVAGVVRNNILPRMVKVIDEPGVSRSVDKDGNWLYAAATRPITAADEARWAIQQAAASGVAISSQVPTEPKAADLYRRRLLELGSLNSADVLYGDYRNSVVSFIYPSRDKAGQYVAAVFAGKSAKPWTKAYRWKNLAEAQAQAHKDATSASNAMRSREDYKAKGKAATDASAGAIRVGDILLSIVSYNMTFVQFYVVTGRNSTGKTIEFRAIESEIVEGDGNSGRKMPVLHSEYGPTLKGQVKGGYDGKPQVKVADREYAYGWDGKSAYFNTLD